MLVQDLPRTFPGHPWLDTPEGHAALRRVLVGYSFRDSDVGYCQVILRINLSFVEDILSSSNFIAYPYIYIYIAAGFKLCCSTTAACDENGRRSFLDACCSLRKCIS